MSGEGSDEEKRKRAAFRRRPGGEGDYEVGYGKPPKETRFKPGRSGNPKGRPKGARTSGRDRFQSRFMEIVLTEAYREVPLREGGRETSVPIVAAVVKTMAVRAAQGNMRAAELLTELLAKTEQVKIREHEACVQEAMAYKTEWEAEIERCRKLGLPEPDLDVHPDQISFDFVTGEVHVTGPLTKEARKRIEDFKQLGSDFEAEIDQLSRSLERTPEPEDAESIRGEIANYEKLLATIRGALPQEDRIAAFMRRVERTWPTER